jgi:transcriptional regulator with XRE-family HTH domain
MRDSEPTIRARELGIALRRAAQAKELRATEIAQQLGWSNSRVSRLYSGKRGSGSRDDIVAVLALCGITGPKRDELLELSSRAYEEGWWQQYGDRLPPELCTLSNYEDAAIAITNFETSVVPGLLQTPAYMRALMSQTPAIPLEEIDQRIKVRRRRQRIFDREYPAKFVFFLDEYALLRTGPGEEIMSEQVHHLLRMSIRPYVQIRIIPDAFGFHAGQAPFMIMRFTEAHPIVFIETQTSALFIERRDTIAGYRSVVADLDSVALDERHSREALAGLANALSAPREDHDEHAPPLEEEFPQ